MKRVEILCVKPPFYKGLTASELGLLMAICTTAMSVIGVPISLMTGWWLVALSAFFLGVMSPVILPKRLLLALAKRKERHCRFYFAKRWHHFYYPERYLLRSETMARKRINHERRHQ
ncbi:hypothetical protein AB4472_09375 [Vibrio lentus]